MSRLLVQHVYLHRARSARDTADLRRHHVRTAPRDEIRMTMHRMPMPMRKGAPDKTSSGFLFLFGIAVVVPAVATASVVFLSPPERTRTISSDPGTQPSQSSVAIAPPP